MAVLPKVVYNFNENSATVIRDYSENGTDGAGSNLTVSATTRSVGFDGVFNGTSSELDMTLESIADSLTITMAINLEAATGTDFILEIDGGGVRVTWDGTDLVFYLETDDGASSFSISHSLSVSTWYDIVLKMDDSTGDMTITVDGTVEATQAVTGTFAFTTPASGIGHALSTDYGKFRLNEFKIYNEAITTAITNALILEQNGVNTNNGKTNVFELGDVLGASLNETPLYAVVSFVGSGTDYRILPLTQGIQNSTSFKRVAHLWDTTRQYALKIDDTPQVCFYDGMSKSSEVFIDAKKTLCLLGDTSTRYIYKQSDFPALSGGLIPLENNTKYVIMNVGIIMTDGFDLSNITGYTSIEGSGTIIYSSSDTLFNGTFTGIFSTRDIAFIGNGTADIWDITGNSDPAVNVLLVSVTLFSNFAGAGSITTLGSFLFDPSFYDEVDGALILNSVTIFSLNNVPFTHSTGSGTPKIVLNGTFVNISISDTFLNIPNGDSFIQISPDITILGKAVIVSNTYNGLTGDFFTPQLTGSITAFANNGSGGTTVTSALHGITDEQKAIIAGTTSYNGTKTLTNVTTNTFDINVVFVADDATGTFDTGDSSGFLDNNSFNFQNNGDQIDTAEIGTIAVNSNFTTTITTQNVPVEINGGGSDWDGLTERRFEFEFLGDNSGTIRYTGDQEKEFVILGKIAYDPAGGSSILATGYIGKNGSIITGSMAIQESSRTATIYPQTIVTLQKNDILSLFIENNDNTQNMAIKIGTGLVASSK